MGGYAEARTPAKEIEHVETDADFRKRYPYPVIGIFGKGWDDLKTLTDEFVTVAKEKTTPERQVDRLEHQRFLCRLREELRQVAA